MHYYKRNIGDYHKKAGRLSILQHGTYTLLIDACYDRERFPTKDEAIDWVWASTREEVEAVEFVLGKFFDLVGGVYVQNRIQEEIDKYHDRSSKNKEIALEREANKRKASTKRARVVNESPPNQEPITNNQEPINTPLTPRAAVGVARYLEDCKASGVDPIPEADAVFVYADSVGIPVPFLRLCWLEFVERNLDSGKRYKDWRAAFRKCVRGGWYRLWAINSGTGEYFLTSAGLQAQAKHRGNDDE